MQFNMGDAKKHSAYLVAAVERGEEVTLARNGKPVAKIVRDETPNEDQRGQARIDELKGITVPPAPTLLRN